MFWKSQRISIGMFLIPRLTLSLLTAINEHRFTEQFETMYNLYQNPNTYQATLQYIQIRIIMTSWVAVYWFIKETSWFLYDNALHVSSYRHKPNFIYNINT